MTCDNNNRVRTLTGKEIELDIESEYKVRSLPAAAVGDLHPRRFEHTARRPCTPTTTTTTGPCSDVCDALHII